ncbi:MAG: hypothetical protein JWN13_3014 [Betaproteobacteria bacterium]|nr:hypothetical protein [Betaproteobacteria bacterium]MEA3155284.1 hypothetical protein [Betaproteobacteria bacterium]
MEAGQARMDTLQLHFQLLHALEQRQDHCQALGVELEITAQAGRGTRRNNALGAEAPIAGIRIQGLECAEIDEIPQLGFAQAGAFRKLHERYDAALIEPNRLSEFQFHCESPCQSGRAGST